MKKLQVRIHEKSSIARFAAKKMQALNVALVLGKTIHLHGVTASDFLKSPSWVAHELQHVRQYERYGFVGFLLRYGYYSLRFGYFNNPLEIEARAEEGNTSLAEAYTLMPPA